MMNFARDSLTKKDFIASFQGVIEVILKVAQKFSGDVEGIKKEFEDFKTQVKLDTEGEVDVYAARADQIIQSAVANMIATRDTRLAEQDAKIALIKPGAPGEPGRPGRDANEEDIFNRLKDLIPDPILPLTAIEIRDELETLEGDNMLNWKAIGGLSGLIDNLKKLIDGKASKGAAGGGRGFFLYVGGVKKGIVSNINFKPGTGMSIAYTLVNGQATVTFNSSGGGGSGVTVETPSESPNASRTVFTVSSEPKWINADGTDYFDGAGYTYDSGVGTVTMDIPPSSFIRAII